jgi:hypothetical protein
MNPDDIKDFAVETCQSAFDMDIREIVGPLEKWGFKIVDSDNMTDPRAKLPCYMLWLECDYGLELAKENLNNWIKELRKDVMLGKWHFVVKYWKRPGLANEFPFDVCRLDNGVSRVRNLLGAVGVTPKDHDAKQWWSHSLSYDPDAGLARFLPPGMTVHVDDVGLQDGFETTEIKLLG